MKAHNGEGLRAEFRQVARDLLRNGVSTPDAILDAIVAQQGADWIEERAQAYMNARTILLREIRSLLHGDKKEADLGFLEQIHPDRGDGAAVAYDPDTLSYFGKRLNGALRTMKRNVAAEILLDLGVAQGMPDGSWKDRSSLTRDDCLALADHHSKQAASNGGMMMAFARLADMLLEEGVDTLGELCTAQPAPAI